MSDFPPLDKVERDILATLEDVSANAMYLFSCWLIRWREAHPDDDRDSYDLIDEYVRSPWQP